MKFKLKLLRDWLHRLTGVKNIPLKLDGMGNLDITEQPPQIKVLLGPFLYNTQYITKEDYNEIRRYWKNINKLEGLAKLFETTYKQPKFKIMPRIDFRGIVGNIVYIGEIRNNRIEVKEVIIPINLAKDNVVLAEMDKGFVSESSSLYELPIIFPRGGIQQIKEKSVYLKNSNLSLKEQKLSKPGVIIGDCIIRERSLIINLGDKWIYWDKDNEGIEINPKDLITTIDIITTFFNINKREYDFDKMISNVNFEHIQWATR